MSRSDCAIPSLMNTALRFSIFERRIKPLEFDGVKTWIIQISHIPRNSIVLRFLIHLPSHPHTYPDTEPPINRAFQAESEGVRVEKEKKYFYFLFVFLPVFSCCFIAIHDFKMELVSIHLYLLSPSGKNQPYLLCISPERSSGFLMCFYDCLQSFACLSAIRHHDATVLTGYPDVFIYGKNAFLHANNIDYHTKRYSRCDRQRETGIERKYAN